MKLRGLVFGLLICWMPQLLAVESSFWVWQRSSVLDSSEINSLKMSGIKQLYWQVGTLVCRNGHWDWSERFPLQFSTLREKAPFLHLIPVVRLEPAPGEPFSSEDFNHLSTILNEIALEQRADLLQIDYEAPDRLIPEYLDFLASLRRSSYSWKVSITALGHWSRFAKKFEGMCDEIVPMFYDLNPTKESLNEGSLPSLLDQASIEKELIDWKGTPVPWKAGLPNFYRVTLVDQNGVSKGNIRSFSLDEICFSPALVLQNTGVQGEGVYLVTKNTVLAETPFHKGDLLFIRYPALSSLLHLKNVATKLGASGILYFRLPAQDDMSGYSSTILEHSDFKDVNLSVHHTEEGCLEIRNDSGVDLMPILSGKERGYAVEIKAAKGSWREALSGDFAMITTDAEGMHPVSEVIGLQTDTLYFWFSHLRSGHSLTSGIVQTIPKEGLSWRIINLSTTPQCSPLD